MKRALFALVPVLALSSVIGCSGGHSSNQFGADPDFNAIQARMASPDGTFNSANASVVFAQYSTQSSGATSADVAGAASAGTSATSALHGGQLKLSDITPTSSGCSDVSLGNLTGTCGCPGGGNFAYDYSDFLTAEESSSATLDVTLRVAMNACVTDNGTISGREFVHMHEDRAAASNTANPTDASVLLVLDVVATLTDGTTQKLDVNELLQEGPQGDTVEVAVVVNDGWVVVSASTDTADDSESYSVRDKNGTWSCSEENGAGTCTDTQGDVTSFGAVATASGG